MALTGETGVMVWSFLHHAFVDGRFYSLFSLMFGIGFAVILARLSQRDATEALTIFRRRLWVLLGIGMVHLCLIWYGDILVLYSLLGFVLVACRTPVRPCVADRGGGAGAVPDPWIRTHLGDAGSAL